jgi:uncharacterized membrane protein YoaK (UPF0700 family)
VEKPNPHRWLCPALAFVAGFVDASTFVGAGGVFCAHVTGNIVLLAVGVVDRGQRGWLSAATLPVFLLAVAIGSRIYRGVEASRSGERARLSLLGFEMAFVAFAALLGLCADPQRAAVRALIVLSAVVAMAAQTTLHRLAPECGPSTTVMTGNLAQWVMDLPSSRPRRRNPLQAHAGRTVASFAVGCAIAAPSVRALGFGMLFIPLVVLIGSALRLRMTRDTSSQLTASNSEPA